MTAPTDKPSRPERFHAADRVSGWVYEANEADAYMDWSDDERASLQQRVAELEAALDEAAEEIAGWGAYASVYFQEKWDLHGCVERFQAIAAVREREGK